MKLTALQKELLLTWLQSHITQEQRQELMREMPLVYSGWCEISAEPAANLNAVARKHVAARRVKT